MLERLLDLFWKPPSVQPHLNKSQGDQQSGSHTRSQHNISRTEVCAPLRGNAFRFAGTAGDIYQWLRGLFRWWAFSVCAFLWMMHSEDHISVNSFSKNSPSHTTSQPSVLKLRSEQLDSNCWSGEEWRKDGGVLRLPANDLQVCHRRTCRWASQLGPMIVLSCVCGCVFVWGPDLCFAPLQSKGVFSGSQCFCFRIKSVKRMDSTNGWKKTHPLFSGSNEGL